MDFKMSCLIFFILGALLVGAPMAYQVGLLKSQSEIERFKVMAACQNFRDLTSFDIAKKDVKNIQ